MKSLITFLVVALLGLGAYYHIEKRTQEITKEIIADEIYTDWVKAAKECETIDTIAIADTIKTVGGNAVR